MFVKLEKDKRAKLLSLYKKYIFDYRPSEIKRMVEDITYDSIYPIYSKEYNHFAYEAKKMIGKKLSIKDAKAIFSKLKKGSIKKSPMQT